MNILYISKIWGYLYSGPTYSVPNQINAQSKYNNVFWYNLIKEKINVFSEFPFYHDLSDYPNKSLDDLPAPFNHPDLVVMEEVYVYRSTKMLKQICKQKIPYIIVPRSQLTKQAQNKKRMKKKIGNFLIYNRIINNAVAIQYLTQQEYDDSRQQWKIDGIVIPNGIKPVADLQEKNYSGDSATIVYIGRSDSYQKGIDLLIAACKGIIENLNSNSVKIHLYIGNIHIDVIKEEIDNKNLQDIIFLHDSIFGDEKDAVLRSADMFIMTSRFEGLPMGLLEALSYGLPCIATRGTNMKDVIDKYDAGWTAETDAESIKSAILDMLRDKNKWKNKSMAAVKLAEEYNWDELAKKSDDFYRRFIK